MWLPLGSRRASDPATRAALARDLFFQEYEPRAGDVVLDVGAGAGEETALLSELVGPGGRVYAVEAHPATFASLERRCREQGLANVTALNVAIAEQPGTVAISEESSYLENRLTSGPGADVEAVTLDALLAELAIERVDFLKMNIEGAELGALRAMRESADRVRNLAVSCHDFLADRGGDASNRTYAGVAALLRDYGYRVVPRRRGDLRPWTRRYLYASRGER